MSVYSVYPAVDKIVRTNLMGKDRFNKLMALSCENIGMEEKRKRWLSQQLSKEEKEQFISQIFDYCMVELGHIDRGCANMDQWDETRYEREHLSSLYYIAGGNPPPW
tara:strand:- start:39 stop:359 length:321 start_codon:yes stop_codon:yes gene_type:complete